MSLLGRALEEREDHVQAEAAADDLWLRERAGIDPEARRKSWMRWARKTLETTLQWPKSAPAKERLIGQSVAELTILARQLRGRGWLLDGEALAVHVRALLTPIAKAQRDGKVEDFWPYFRASVRRYVGSNAEEIQQHAKRIGADEGAQSMAGALAAFGLGVEAQKRAPSITEIIADRAADIASEKGSRRAADAAQMPLL